MHTTSDKLEIMIGNKTSGIIKKLFNSLLQKYQEGLGDQWEEMNLCLIVLIYCIISFNI